MAQKLYTERLDSVFLAQTDTTAGFLSRNPASINEKKGAIKTKPLLLEVAKLNYIPHRIPVNYRTFVRRAKKTSFILPNGKSFRVVHEELHKQFLLPFKCLYSSSANRTHKRFNYEFAIKQCDIIIYDKRGIFEAKSSTILKIGCNKVKKVR